MEPKGAALESSTSHRLLTGGGQRLGLFWSLEAGRGREEG